MNVVDSNAWIGYFVNASNATYFSRAVEQRERLVVPTICLYEMYKRIAQRRDEYDAPQAVTIMRQGRVGDLDTTLAMHAARLSGEYRLPHADNVGPATTRAYKATLWTQDADFAMIEGVRCRAHQA